MISIVFIIASTILFVLAMNVSFSAHLREKNRDLWYTHLYSLALTAGSCAFILIAANLWSK